MHIPVRSLGAGAAALALVLAGACSSTTAPGADVAAGESAAPVDTVAPTTPPTEAPAVTAPPAPEPTAPPTTVALLPPPRAVAEQAWVPFAEVAGIVLHHPSHRVERIGFHQSNHEGARDMAVLPSAAGAFTLDSRGRLTGAHTAADIVMDPAVAVRSPVTGVVKRAGTYTLYCDNVDEYVVIAPDAQPAWEVKLLHIRGLSVTTGQRVVAGETVIAAGPNPLPFESQVDEHTAEPSWPHGHLEVVDPSIPNRPNGGGGGCP